MTDDLVVRLLAAIDEFEQCATAAGHGFGHLPLSHELNAGWTQLDLTQNVRPQNFARACGPDHVRRLCQAHRKVIDSYQRTTQLLAEANQRVLQQVMDGTVSTRQEQRDFDSLHIEEAVLHEVIEELAEGYGIEAKP